MSTQSYQACGKKAASDFGTAGCCGVAGPIHSRQFSYLRGQFDDDIEQLESEGGHNERPLSFNRQQTAKVARRIAQQATPAWNLPYTVEWAIQPSDVPRAIVNVSPPFKVVQVNDAWLKLFGCGSEEIEEQPALKRIKGPATDDKHITKLTESMQLKCRDVVNMVVYTCDGKPVLGQVVVTPLMGADGHKSRMLLQVDAL